MAPAGHVLMFELDTARCKALTDMVFAMTLQKRAGRQGSPNVDLFDKPVPVSRDFCSKF